MRLRIPWMAVVTVLIILFLYLPLVVVVLYAFNSGSNLSWPPEGLSLRWFRNIFDTPEFRDSLLLSLRIGLIVALLSGIVGGTAALVFTRRRSWGTRLVEAASRLPVMLPPLFLGIALLVAMQAADVVPSLWSIVLAHVVIVVPYVIVIVAARLETFDLDLELAARDLGAGPLQTLRRVTLRAVGPAMLGAALLAFAFSVDETLVTNLVSGDQVTLPLYVYSKLRRTVDPSINAVAAMLLILPWIALGIAWLLLRRSLQGPRREQEGTR
jgi:ABC-type spermidine/putrescine transport system permease subunit II